MKIHSWNVNGLRAVQKKNFDEYFEEHQPDILLLQETKAHPDQVENLPFENLGQTFWNSADKKGYSGVLSFSREAPINIFEGLNIAEHDTEGRVITLEYPDFFLTNVYTPNAQNELRRLDYRLKWDADFLAHMKSLEATKPVIFAGDLNVAHDEIDLARPKGNRKNPGFSDEERASFDNIVNTGFVDTFRHFHPDEPDHYSWWSYRAGARGNNVGWRLDYFCVSESMLGNVKSAEIHSEVLGSDHCPVELILG
ncbi:MAG: exodeoxyribonuclease III [Verrucomicrobiales bacterium]